MKKKEGTIGIVLAICLLSAFTSPVLAGGLTVYGGKIETSVSPGSNYSYTMKVENTMDEPIDIGVEVKGYGTSPNSDFIALEPDADKSPYTARELLAVSPNNFHLETGKSQVVTVTANIPSGIGDGGRYAIVFIHTAPKGEMVATISAVAARVLLTIDGSKLIHNSEVIPDNLKPGKPLEAMVTVTNKGNHNYKPHLRGALRKGDKTFATASLDADWPIIPGYSRQFNLNFVSNETVLPDKYDVYIEVRDDSGNPVGQNMSSFEVEKPYVPPPSPTNITLTPGNASVLETENKVISISFPKGAVTGQVEVSLKSYPMEQLPPPPNGFKLANTSFRIDGLNGLLAKEATITVKYPADDLDKAGGDASRLRLARWDEAENQWSVLDTDVNKEALTLTANTNRFSIWAVMVAPPTVVNWVFIGSIVVAVIIIGLLFIAIRRRLTKSKNQTK